MVPITRTRAFLYLAVTFSVYWAVLLATGYRRSDYDALVGGPPWAEELIWKVYLRGPGENDTRELILPKTFQAGAVKGDRVEQLTHSVEFLGLKFFASEAVLWRQEQVLRVWRQHPVPIPLLAILWALVPLLVAVFVIGSIRWVRPGYRIDQRTLRVVLGGAGLVIFIVCWFVVGYSESGAALVQRAAERFKGVAWFEGHPDGAWTGDVTEFYRMGAIRRAVAEADAAPIRPLVEKPRPYHGYYFVAMETGPGNSDDPVPLKPGPRSRESFAFCAFPAKEGPDQQVWLVCPTGFFGRRMEGGKPVLHWPSPKEMQQGWGRYCRLDVPGPVLLASGR